MIIGIDGNEANVEKRVGIGEYAFELLLQFANSKFEIRPFGLAQGENSKFVVYLKEEPRRDMPLPSEYFRYRLVRPRKLWTQIGLPFDLFTQSPRPDVFFSPTHYAPRFSPVPTAIAIMDMSFIKYPNMFKRSDLYQLKNWTSYSVKKASKIFTISKASKDDIIEIYQVPKERVVVTYPGVKQISNIPSARAQGEGKYQTSNMDKVRNKYGIKGEYILFVGTLQPRKNIVRLVDAFAKIARGPVSLFPHPTSSVASLPAGARRGPSTPVKQASSFLRSPALATPRSTRSLSLIVVGKKGWLYEEILEAPKKFGVEDKVIFLDFVPDEDLVSLYKNALCFVLPSLYEGFGLPVLEAIKNGCPVIISNVSSLPEAGGDAALYVDPYDVDDIASKIASVIKSDKLRTELIEKGYKQVKKFSWEKTAKETLKVLEEVAKKNS